MTELRPELYEGREQTYVKHFVLESYLEKLAYKICSWRTTLNYIDGFAGPWQSKGERLEDTSPHIAVRVLRGVRDGLRRQGGSKLDVRAMFVESDAERYRRLLASFDEGGDVAVVVRRGAFESLVSEAVTFGSTGSDPFCFTFIDPCGWKGYGLNAIAPVLSLQPGEVLINFMFPDINRFIDYREPANAETFKDLFGSTDFSAAWSGLQGLDREEAIVTTYSGRIRSAGSFKHVVSAVIINPLKNRSHYHLIYGTRHAEGLKTFRDAERRASRQQDEMRARAQERARHARSGGQRELYGPAALTPPYVDSLGERYHTRARDIAARLLSNVDTVSFDELAIAAMQQPMTSVQDVRDYLTEELRRGSLTFVGLRGRERTPQWGRGHVIRLLRS